MHIIRVWLYIIHFAPFIYAANVMMHKKAPPRKGGAWSIHHIIVLQLGQTVTVGNGINFASGLAHGTFLGILADVTGNIIRGEDAVHGDLTQHIYRREDSGDTLHRDRKSVV